MPKVQGTFGFNAEYRGFSVNSSFYFQVGGDYYNSTLVNKIENADWQYNMDRRVYTDRWRPAPDGEFSKSAKYKTFSTANGQQMTRPTSRFVQKKNELQMTSLNLSYDFRNHAFIQNSFLERLKVSFYWNDVFRLSTVKTERGTEYPFARNFSFRVQATF